jgi:cysteinyl-tRNA synthetase
MRLYWQVEKVKKYGELNKFKPKENTHNPPKDDPEFILWKSELNKELMEFWKTLTD